MEGLQDGLCWPGSVVTYCDHALSRRGPNLPRRLANLQRSLKLKYQLQAEQPRCLGGIKRSLAFHSTELLGSH